MVMTISLSRYSVIKYRSEEDFKWGSFDVYVKSNEIIISGILKRGNRSRFMLIRKNE